MCLGQERIHTVDTETDVGFVDVLRIGDEDVSPLERIGRCTITGDILSYWPRAFVHTSSHTYCKKYRVLLERHSEASHPIECLIECSVSTVK